MDTNTVVIVVAAVKRMRINGNGEDSGIFVFVVVAVAVGCGIMPTVAVGLKSGVAIRGYDNSGINMSKNLCRFVDLVFVITMATQTSSSCC